MQIKIYLCDNSNEPYIKTDFYKSIEAYRDPHNYENQCFNCACIINLNEENKIKLLNNIIQVIETSINQLLNTI